MSFFQLRNPACPWCRHSTTGDCGRHGVAQATIVKALAGDPEVAAAATCPVCRGAQVVPASTYEFVPLGYGDGMVGCRSCGGTGVVWR